MRNDIFEFQQCACMICHDCHNALKLKIKQGEQYGCQQHRWSSVVTSNVNIHAKKYCCDGAGCDCVLLVGNNEDNEEDDYNGDDGIKDNWDNDNDNHIDGNNASEC